MLRGDEGHGVLVIGAIATVIIHEYIGHPGAENLVEGLGVARVAFHKVAVEVVIAGVAPETVGLRAVLVGAAERIAVQAAVDIVHRDHHDNEMLQHGLALRFGQQVAQ